MKGVNMVGNRKRVADLRGTIVVETAGGQITLACKRRPGVIGECNAINTGTSFYHGGINEIRCTTCNEELHISLDR